VAEAAPEIPADGGDAEDDPVAEAG
jgi:hypothetical protein